MLLNINEQEVARLTQSLKKSNGACRFNFISENSTYTSTFYQLVICLLNTSLKKNIMHTQLNSKIY